MTSKNHRALALRPAAGRLTVSRMTRDFSADRQRLVEHLRRSPETNEPRILAAFAAVSRHEFVAPSQSDIAYDDRAVPLDEGQTVSQPSMVAIMLHELGVEPEHRVLEIGAGSGYAAALLARLAHQVYAIELRPTLVERARGNLARAGVEGVHLLQGDGSWGLPAHAPFDRILVSAAPSEVPEALGEQLAVGGRLVIPVGNEHQQTLLVGDKLGPREMSWRHSVGCIFVPLVNTHDGAG